LGLDRLYAVGRLAAEAARAFGSGGVAYDDHATLAAALRPQLNENVALLIKGSRSARMERVVAALTGEPSGGAESAHH
ncbi:MAG: UDP-N-acetylmuramoyl-tripeptide--D-alanyl-D-alanine ligase, partial [Stenotrophobium sp.]